MDRGDIPQYIQESWKDPLLLVRPGVESQTPATIAMADEEVTVVVWLQKLEHPLRRSCPHSQLKRRNISFANKIKLCNPLS